MKKYYELGKKHPKAKKYLDKKNYDYRDFNGRKFLVDLKKGERVGANPRAAGKPRYMAINGQKIYNGEASKHIRAKILSAIKEQMSPYIDKLDPVKDFPICIEMELHDIIREPNSNSLWDVDNRAWPYIKAFQDCLTGNKDKNGKKRNKVIIPDDNILFITTPPVPKFIPVEDEKDRKLVFRLVSEKDKRILGNKTFINELKTELDEATRISIAGQQDVEKGRRLQRTNPRKTRIKRGGR